MELSKKTWNYLRKRQIFRINFKICEKKTWNFAKETQNLCRISVKLKTAILCYCNKHKIFIFGHIAQGVIFWGTVFNVVQPTATTLQTFTFRYVRYVLNAEIKKLQVIQNHHVHFAPPCINFANVSFKNEIFFSHFESPKNYYLLAFRRFVRTFLSHCENYSPNRHDKYTRFGFLEKFLLPTRIETKVTFMDIQNISTPNKKAPVRVL